MTEEATRKVGVSEVEAQAGRERIAELLLVTEEGGPDGVEEAVRIARRIGEAEEVVRDSFRDAVHRAKERVEADEVCRKIDAAFIVPASQPIGVQQPGGVTRFRRIIEEPKPKPPPEAKPEPVAAPAVVTKPAPSPLLYGFEKLPEAPSAPAGAGELERLTYPPGLLGWATDHAFRCTDLPDRQLALWGAKAGLGKIVDRKLITPTGGSTVAYDLLLAATGAGKEAAIQFMLLLLRSAGPGYAKLFQGGMLASVQAVEDLVRLTPNCLIVIDEFGRWFRMLQEQSGNVSELPGALCKLWGQKPNGRYGIIRRSVGRSGAEPEQVEIQWPALSLAGASVAEPFWDACGDEDISGGFLNRCQIYDIGIGSEDLVEPTADPDQREDWFVKAVLEVARGGPMWGSIPFTGEPKPGFEHLAPFAMGWGDRVKEAYRDHVSEIRKLPADSRRRELSIRTPEIALREATKLARWCGSRVVDEVHWAWGWAWACHSRDLVSKVRTSG
jgi:hypothetical protein